MPQSLSRVLVHLVFSTKNREPTLAPAIRQELHLASTRNQPRHHQKMTFQDEYRRFMELQRVEFDERYVWD
jgi:hypothetical protein